MSDKDFETLSLADMLEEMGISSDNISKRTKTLPKEEPIKTSDIRENLVDTTRISYDRVETFEFSSEPYEEFLEDDEVTLKSHTRASAFAKDKSSFVKNQNVFVFTALILALYSSLSVSLALPMPEFLTYIDHPYAFFLFNVVLHIIALICSADMLIDGFKSILSPNINTLVGFTSIVTLFQTCATVMLPNPLGYLPFTSISILVLFFANSSFSHMLKSNSYSLKVCSMTGHSQIITQSSNVSSGFLFKTDVTDNNFSDKITPSVKSYNFSIFSVISILLIILLAYYTNKNGFQGFLWSLSALSVVILPLNFINYYSLPFKVLSNRLFLEGAFVPTYKEAKSVSKNSHILLDDNDLFPAKSIYIDTIDTFHGYTENEIISVLVSIYSALNLSSKQAFERELVSRYIRAKKIKDIKTYENGGYSFNVGKTEVCVGNKEFTTKLGITIDICRMVKNPIYVSIAGKIIAVVSLKYFVDPKVSRLLTRAFKNSFKVALQTKDFNITPVLIKNLFEIDEDMLDSDEKTLAKVSDLVKRDELIYISRFSGFTYLLSILECKKCLKSVRFNLLIGGISYLLGLSIVSYLLYNFSPYMLLPQNLLLFMIFWYIPSFIVAKFHINI